MCSISFLSSENDLEGLQDGHLNILRFLGSGEEGWRSSSFGITDLSNDTIFCHYGGVGVSSRCPSVEDHVDFQWEANFPQLERPGRENLKSFNSGSGQRFGERQMLADIINNLLESKVS